MLACQPVVIATLLSWQSGIFIANATLSIDFVLVMCLPARGFMCYSARIS